MAFSWKHCIERTEQHWMEKLACLSNSNPDFRAQHPEIVKEMLNESIKNKVETKKFILKKMEKAQRYSEIPKPSVVIKRLNRVV